MPKVFHEWVFRIALGLLVYFSADLASSVKTLTTQMAVALSRMETYEKDQNHLSGRVTALEQIFIRQANQKRQ